MAVLSVGPRRWAALARTESYPNGRGADSPPPRAGRGEDAGAARSPDVPAGRPTVRLPRAAEAARPARAGARLTVGAGRSPAAGGGRPAVSGARRSGGA